MIQNNFFHLYSRTAFYLRGQTLLKRYPNQPFVLFVQYFSLNLKNKTNLSNNKNRNGRKRLSESYFAL